MELNRKRQACDGQQKLPFPGTVDCGDYVTFTLYAPDKKSVHLIGDFNDWQSDADAMEQLDRGLWSIRLKLPRGTFGYQFLIDGELVICDPYAQFVEEDPGERPRKAIVKAGQDPFEWKHDSWQRPRFQDLRIYEMHIADFTPQRDFREAVERLAYVSDLGMNAIELMPVFGVHENKGWGYTPTYVFAPNEDYGSPDELRWLIDEAHGKGLAIILDMVLAHTGQKHPFNQMYSYEQSPWYGQGPNGGNEYGLPQLDYSKPATRDFAGDVLDYWLREFHIDGFRFDYIKSIGVTSEGYGIPTLAWAARQTRPEVYLIGEHLPENPGLMISADMDGAWHVRFSYAIKALLCQREIGGYDSRDFDRCVRTLEAAAEGYAEKPTCMVNYVESHDEERIILELKQAGNDEDTARRKSALAATILFTAVGEPMIYHGQTFGQDTPKNMDHNYLDWEKLETASGGELHNHYKRMAKLRVEKDCLRTSNIALDAVLSDQRCLVYHRWNEVGEELVVVANFSPETRTISVPMPSNGKWHEFFSDQEAEMGGEVTVEVESWSARIFYKV